MTFLYSIPEPGTSGLEKTAPSGELEFFRFFHFSPKARGPLKIFDIQFSEISKKKFQKWLHWDLSGIEWNKVMDFGEAIPIPLDMADGFTVGRDDLTPSQVE